MAIIPENIKTAIKSGTVNQLSAPNGTLLGTNIMDMVKLAVNNKLTDGKSYTYRINFNNGRIIGDNLSNNFSVEELDGRSPTGRFILPGAMNTQVFEYSALFAENLGRIDNGGAWVARVSKVSDRVTDVSINPDFNAEDQKILKDILQKGLKTMRPM